MKEKVLSVVNASAGSGKTYRLVKDYIKLLIGESGSAKGFSSIVAMTFTNKAALEMKERIIQGLDDISSEDRQKSGNLTLEIAKDLGMEPDIVIDRCRKSLSEILHQYEDFNVMTIDKFNLKLIKSFSRDLDLPPDFEIIMNEEEVIEKVVDDLLNQLDERSQTELNRLIYEYAKSNIDEENGWNFRRNLIDFAKILKLERNQKITERLLESDLTFERFNQERKELFIVDADFKKLQNELATSAQDIADPGSLPGGGTTFNKINSIIELKRFPSQDDFIKKQFSGYIDQGTKDKQFPDEVQSALVKIRSFWQDHLSDYYRKELYLKNYFNLALLKFMAQALDTTRKDEQLIRISEFNALISKLIRDEEAPFIYERLGNRYRHFLLDEFQDTSHLQWLNIVPLIYDSLANLYPNLIVGDPKQSIYRFKNGIAEQFIELPGIYNPENDPKLNRISDYFRSLGKVYELLDNWRSSKVIVDFNNGFFECFKSRMPEHAKSYYSSIHQTAQRSIPGKVHIISEQTEVDETGLVPGIEELIKECRKDGFEFSDICILGGRNVECNSWAIELNDRGYKVVSADSLLISKDQEVQLCIAYLQWRLRPAGTHEKKRFAELYFRHKNADFNAYSNYIKEKSNNEGKTYRYFDDQSFIIDHFESREDFFFKFEHLYDLLTGFLRLIGLDELSNPYLHHLADIVFNYGQRKGPDLNGFLDEYEKNKNNYAVQIPESKDAIKVMTIHKSKGLEFPVVIIPAIDFNLDIKGDLLIESGDDVLYKKPGKNDFLQELKEMYTYESEHILIDYINLCYVGMTRPKERLYIMNYHRKGRFGSIFHEVIKELDVEKHQSEEAIEITIKSEEGERPIRSEISGNYFSPKSFQDLLWFPDIALQDKEELLEEEYLSDEMRYGRQFHNIISQINSEEEIEDSLDKGIREGLIDMHLKKRLTSGLKDVFNMKEYVELISNKTSELNEKDIIVDVDKVLRPDKVLINGDEVIIIDYKTGAPQQKDQKQVLEYKENFLKMGYQNVSAYLLYTSEPRLEKQ